MVFVVIPLPGKSRPETCSECMTRWFITVCFLGGVGCILAGTQDIGGVGLKVGLIAIGIILTIISCRVFVPGCKKGLADAKERKQTKLLEEGR